VQITPGAQGTDFVQKAGCEHGIKALGNAAMQPSSVVGFKGDQQS
jgi:hypothetical protein